MRTAAHIIETVGKLVKKYDTRDPYELCKCLEIKIQCSYGKGRNIHDKFCQKANQT